MRIGTYTLDHGPSRGWSGVRQAPRTRTTPTIGGVRVAVQQGNIGDEIQSLPFGLMDATPAKTVVRDYAAVGTDHGLTAGQRRAFHIPIGAGAFGAISAARLRLKEVGMVGYVRVEVWDTDAGTNLPMDRVGILGVLEAADIGAAYGDVDVIGPAAWPIGFPEGWLVLSGEELTAGTVSWDGDAVPAPFHALATPSAGISEGDLNPSIDMTGDLTSDHLQILVDGSGITREVEFDWTAGGGCNTGVKIAAEMETKIQALGGVYAAVTVTYDHAPAVDHYTITSGTVGEGSAVNLADSPAENCCVLLKLAVANGGTETAGACAWAAANHELQATVWQGGQALVLAGLVGAYHGRGDTYEIEFDGDEQIYTAQLTDLTGAGYRLQPSVIGDFGHVARSRLRFILSDER